MWDRPSEYADRWPALDSHDASTPTRHPHIVILNLIQDLPNVGPALRVRRPLACPRISTGANREHEGKNGLAGLIGVPMLSIDPESSSG